MNCRMNFRILTSKFLRIVGSCTFELGLCTWRNQQNGNNKTIQDEFDWTLGSGSTYSYYTGPSSDHTTGSALGKLTGPSN